MPECVERIEPTTRSLLADRLRLGRNLLGRNYLFCCRTWVGYGQDSHRGSDRVRWYPDISRGHIPRTCSPGHCPARTILPPFLHGVGYFPLTTTTVRHSTPCSKKTSLLMFDNNFGKCRPIFKILLPGVCKKISVYTSQSFFHLTCNIHYLVKVENPKMLPNFHVERDN